MGARLVLFAVVAGCYTPQPQAGAPCGPGNTCPDGLTCSQDLVCVDPSAGPDGPIVDGPPSDVAVTDGPPVDTGPTVWKLVQTKDRSGGKTITFDATAEHHLLIVGLESENAITSISDDAGNTYLRVPDSRGVETVDMFGVELWYVADTKAGATSLSVTAPGPVFSIDIWEVGDYFPAAIDAVATLDDQPATTSPDGPAITTATAGEFVISIVIVADRVESIDPTGDFTNDHSTFFNGWAHLTDPMAPAGTYQAHWTSTTGPYCGSTVAFRRN